jgi:hypothetical protein
MLTKTLPTDTSSAAAQPETESRATFRSSAETASDGAQVVQNSCTIAGENEGFATPMGPQEALTGAKSELLDRPKTPRERLSTVLARVSSPGIHEILAVAVTQEQVLVHRVGRPAALDEAAQKKVCLLLKVGYTRALAAAELGVAGSTITRTMKRDAAFRQQVLQAEELFERTPLLTIVEAAQSNWRAAAWLMKNYQPHQSVERRKRKQRRRESDRDSREFFATAFDNMKGKRCRKRGLEKGTTTVTKKGDKTITKTVYK